MNTLHDNDAGYVEFYKDVLNDLDIIRSIPSFFDVSDEFSSEFIVEQYEFWIEEAFFQPEHGDDVLAIHTAMNILELFKGSEVNTY